MDKIYSRTKISIPRNVKKIKDKKKFIFIIFFLITIITSVKIMIDSVSPVFEKLCEDEAKSIATLVTNEKATEVMNKHNYEEMFTIEKDSSGNITMVKSNIYPINDIISDAARKIQEDLNSRGKEDIEIPLGSFSGIKLLAGRGPGVKIKISSIGNIDTDLRSEFTAKGINQTLHRVYLQVNCEVSILTPFKDITKSISNQVLLIENVIMGKIPETYYNIEGISLEKFILFHKKI